MQSGNYNPPRQQGIPTRRGFVKARHRSLLLAVALLLAGTTRALAHNAPPYPIIVDKNLDPCVVSVWADPDVGTGTFFIVVEPTSGGKLPEDIRAEVGVRPVSGRLPEAFYVAEREDLRGRVQYKALVKFDAQELWRVRVRLQSSQGGGEAVTDVEVTPPGYGRWDLLLYLLPFVAVGSLWLRVVVGGRGRSKVPQP
jgi:hypothetical protein